MRAHLSHRLLDIPGHTGWIRLHGMDLLVTESQLVMENMLIILIPVHLAILVKLVQREEDLEIVSHGFLQSKYHIQ